MFWNALFFSFLCFLSSFCLRLIDLATFTTASDCRFFFLLFLLRLFDPEDESDDDVSESESELDDELELESEELSDSDSDDESESESDDPIFIPQKSKKQDSIKYKTTKKIKNKRMMMYL